MRVFSGNKRMIYSFELNGLSIALGESYSIINNLSASQFGEFFPTISTENLTDSFVSEGFTFTLKA